jgi:uncharacterized protein (DUF488 family)
MTHPFFTVGHSNRTIDEFIEILREARIGLVVDVRRLPGSRAHPHFDSDRLEGSLAAVQIDYELLAALGGRRGKAEDVEAGTNASWRNRSFHNYADYALSREFHAGLEHLIRLGAHRRCAIMCSEAVWWRCHRRIIADHLLARGMEVRHLMAKGRTEAAVPTTGAAFQDGTVVYPADSSG